MTIRNRPAALFLTCLAAPILLTACSPGSPEAGHPETAPPAATTGTPTNSVSAPGTTAWPSTADPTVQPTRPEAAAGSTLAAGEAFLGYYVALLNYSYATGDPGPFLAESDKGCIGCAGLADYARKVNAKNGSLEGDYKDQLVDVKEIYRGESGRLGGSATVKTGAYRERPSPDATPVPQAGSTGTMEFTLSPSGGNWVMFEMQIKE